MSEKKDKNRSSWRPAFLREIRQLTDETGIMDATRTLLERNNISVVTTGSHERLREHSGGMLFVGDHRNQWEFVGLMAILSDMGRRDMRNIAKFYVKQQVASAIGHAAAQNIIPVYPRILARDRPPRLDSETMSRIKYRRHLLTTEAAARVNTQALEEATDYLEASGAVNIFPCGSVVDSLTHPWRQGVGRIVRQIKPAERNNVLIAPYRMVDASWLRLIASVAMRGRGFAGRPQTLELEFAPVYSAAEVVEMLPPVAQDDPIAITDQLRQNYVTAFGGGPTA